MPNHVRHLCFDAFPFDMSFCTNIFSSFCRYFAAQVEIELKKKIDTVEGTSPLCFTLQSEACPRLNSRAFHFYFAKKKKETLDSE